MPTLQICLLARVLAWYLGEKIKREKTPDHSDR